MRNDKRKSTPRRCSLNTRQHTHYHTLIKTFTLKKMKKKCRRNMKSTKITEIFKAIAYYVLTYKREKCSEYGSGWEKVY